MSLILKRILDTKDLDAWAKLKKHHFTSPWSDVYSLIHQYYSKYSALPNAEELNLITRDKYKLNLIAAIGAIEVPDVETELLVDAVINEYAQSETLKELDKLLERITLMESSELIEEINSIALHLEDKTVSPESEVKINQLDSTTRDSEVRVPLGICNDLDAHTGYLQGGDFFMYGGYRGSGKSVIGMNICNNQLDIGNSSIFFSIEMSAKECFDRLIAMRSGVNHSRIRKQELTDTDLDKIVKVKAAMAENENDLLELWDKNKDLRNWEHEFAASKLKPSQLVVVSDPNLTTTAIDAQVAKYKARMGKKLKLVVVDYINELNDYVDTYDWKGQTQVSKALKKIAVKHDIVLVSPYQTDESGKIKFAKSIEVPADYSYTVENTGDTLKFTNTKVRGSSIFHFEVGIEWPTLSINPSVNFFSSDNVQEKPKAAKNAKKSKGFVAQSDDLEL